MDLSKLERDIEDTKAKLKQERQYQTDLEILEQYSGPDKVLDLLSLKEIAKERDSSNFLVKTDILGLDAIVGGFRPEEVVVLTAPTGHGKTTILQTFTHTFVKNGVPCLWFSFEVTGMNFYNKFNSDEVLLKTYSPSQLKDADLNWIETRIMEGVAKFDTRIVFVDDLHHLVTLELLSKVNNTSIAIGLLLQRLKLIAAKTRTTIFLVAHTTKIEFDEYATIADIRDSSFIAQHADTVLILNRIMEKSKLNPRIKNMTNRALLSVQKNRNGQGLGTVEVVFINGLYSEASVISQ